MSIPKYVNGKIVYESISPKDVWVTPYSNAHREFIKYAGKLQALALANELPQFDTGNEAANEL
jgi:hypothetical protein